MNAVAERFVRFGENSLRHVLTEYLAHYHEERPDPGQDYLILLPSARPQDGNDGPIECRERLGGRLKYDECKAT